MAQDLYSYTSKLIISENTKITEEMIRRLDKLDINLDNSVLVYKQITPNSTIYKSEAFSKFATHYKRSIPLLKDSFMKTAQTNQLDISSIENICEMLLEGCKDSDVILNCIHSIKNVDECTYVHSVNTALYCMLIGTWAEMNEEEIERLILSGILHDIGKIKIPKHVLNKPSRLTEEEYQIVKQHTVLGYEIISQVKSIHEDVKEAALLHHERIDSRGYPLQIQINRYGAFPSIVAIADVYDAITSDRPYKKGRTPFEALEILTSNPGVFDLNILRIFIKNLIPFLIGTRVVLNNGAEGHVVFIPFESPIRPIIKTLNGSFIHMREHKDLQIQQVLGYSI